MTRAWFTKSLLTAAFCTALPGCPDDGGADPPAGTTGTSGQSTSAAQSSSTDAATQGATATSAASESTGATCGGVVCTDDETCVDDICTPSEPPAMCDAPVAYSDPQCEPCAARMCCAQVQACFGDGTSETPTSCAVLWGCVEDNCIEIEDEAEFDACLEEQCAATPPDLEVLFAAAGCVSECLVVGPGTEETCDIVP